LLARSVSHVSLLNVLVLLVLWSALHAYNLRRQLEPAYPTTLSFTLLGVFMAAAFYEHYTGLLAGLGILLFILYLRYTRQPVLRQVWWNSAYALALALILSLPYLISVVREPSATSLNVLWAQRPPDPLAFFESIGRTLLAFGFSGDSSPTHNIPDLPFISATEAVLLYVGIWNAVRRWRQPAYALVLIFFLLGLLPDIWLNEGPSYPALTFLIPSMYMLVGIGVIETLRFMQNQRDIPERLAWLKRNRWLGEWPKPLVRLTALFILLGLILSVRNLPQDLFERWPERDDVQVAYHANLGEIAIYLDRHLDAPPSLICTGRLAEAPADEFSEDVSDIQMLNWMLYHDIPFRAANCQNHFVFLNAGAQMQILFVNPDDLGRIRPLLQNSWFRFAQPVANTNLPTGTLWTMNVEQELANTGGQLARQGTRPETATYYPRSSGQELEIAPHPARFGGNLTFWGYDRFPPGDIFNPGNILMVMSYWRIDGPVLPEAGIFVRLHDNPQISPYTEFNAFAVLNERLQPRDVVVQVASLTLPSTLPQQNYILTIGVYNELPTNQLPVYDSVTGQVRGDYLLLGRPFTVIVPE
jgi:hypothetical protein